MYVDDCLRSDDDLETAISVIKQLRPLFQHYGFNLTKFASDNVKIMSQIPESDRASNLMDLDFENSDAERALGVVWNVAKDAIEIRTRIQPREITRRGIASQIAQVYDPLGIVAPFLLPARLLLQQLTRDNIDWDAPVEGTHKSHGLKWTNCLTELDKISLPQCYKPPGFVPTSIPLHSFADSSKSGYSACCYFRFEDIDGKVHVSFVRGISRVIPKDAPTIPRLELTAAVACAKLARDIIKDIDYKIDSVYYWTDNTSVLQCIKNTLTRFHTFVHNRLQKIRALTRVEEWRNVESSNNPADIGSCGLMPNKWPKAEMWFYGPKFFRQVSDPWKMCLPPNYDLSQTEFNCEIVSTLGYSTSSEKPLNKFLLHFSSFIKLLRCTAWILRICSMLLRRSKETKDHNASDIKPYGTFLTVEELENATKEIIRLCQIESFPEIRGVLDTSNNNSRVAIGKDVRSRIPKSLAKLMPYVSGRVLRVGGRLRRSTLSEDTKNPMILPSGHHVTRLIIQHYHRVNGHCGRLQVLSLFRERFWVMKGQTTIRKTIAKCLCCQRRKATLGSQYMADLVESRVTPGKNVFHYTMVDYFGPLVCRQNRTELKCYGCIFTCMCTRAEHLEVVDSLEASAFLMAFFKFCVIRGNPAHLFSDNGTNFIGAQRELGKAIRRLNTKSINSSLAER